jgi:hypothetical protein
MSIRFTKGGTVAAGAAAAALLVAAGAGTASAATSSAAAAAPAATVPPLVNRIDMIFLLCLLCQRPAPSYWGVPCFPSSLGSHGCGRDPPIGGPTG